MKRNFAENFTAIKNTKKQIEYRAIKRKKNETALIKDEKCGTVKKTNKGKIVLINSKKVQKCMYKKKKK